MSYTAELRKFARNALRGKWPIAILTGFVASLIGAGVATGSGGSFNNNSDSMNEIINELQTTELWLGLGDFFMIVATVFAIWTIGTIIIRGAGKLGYAIFNLKLVDGKNAAFSDLFSQFGRLGAGFCMDFLMNLFVFLWGLLFIIPGIVKGYSYAMAPYILAETPDMTARDAITESRRIMDGNKFSLFCLQLSFIGWALLCTLPVVIALSYIVPLVALKGDFASIFWLIPCSIPTFIGSLFLMSYQEAAVAAFYRSISG